MTTVNLAVIDGDDDAYEDGNGGSFSNSNDRLLIRSSTTAASRFNSGMRFPSATIPAGATIDSCVWQVYAKASDDDMEADIFFNDVDDAVDFADDADVTTRIASAATSAGVTWSELTLDAPAQYASSPSLVAPCQEVIDRPGWASGQALCVLAEGRNQATVRRMEGAAFEFTGSTESLLDIDYTSGDVTLSVTPAVLKLAGVVPSVSVSGTAIAVAPSVLILNTKAVVVTLGAITLAAPVAVLKLAAVAPTVQANVTLAVTPAVLKLVGVAPGVSVSAITLAVSPAVLALQGIAPVVVAGVTIAVTPSALALAAINPTVQVGAVIIAVPVAVLKLVGVTPAVTADVILVATPAVLRLVAMAPAISVSVISIPVTPAVLRLLAIAPIIAGVGGLAGERGIARGVARGEVRGV